MTPARAQQLHQQAQQAQQQQQACGGGQAAGLHRWPSTEHYYQSQKFAGVAHPEAQALVAAIAAARSPEEAARLGRRAERQRQDLLRPDWAASKPAVMLAALRAKFTQHDGPRRVLLATARNCGGRGCDGGTAASGGEHLGLEIVETSPNDFFWGRGYNGTGSNMLGKLLMQVRREMAEQAQQPAKQPQQPAEAQQQPHLARRRQQKQQQGQPPLAAAQ